MTLLINSLASGSTQSGVSSFSSTNITPTTGIVNFNFSGITPFVSGFTTTITVNKPNNVNVGNLVIVN